MNKYWSLLICLFFLGLINIYAQTTVTEPYRTASSAVRKVAEIIQEQRAYLSNFNSARIDIKATNAEELFRNNNDRYLVVAFPVPERNSYLINLFFRDAGINLAILFDNSNFAYKIPDQLDEVFDLFQDIAIIIWQSSSN